MEEQHVHKSAVIVRENPVKEVHIFSDHETFKWHLENDNMYPIWGDLPSQQEYLPNVFIAGR